MKSEARQSGRSSLIKSHQVNWRPLSVYPEFRLARNGTPGTYIKTVTGKKRTGKKHIGKKRTGKKRICI